MNLKIVIIVFISLQLKNYSSIKEIVCLFSSFVILKNNLKFIIFLIKKL